MKDLTLTRRAALLGAAGALLTGPAIAVTIATPRQARGPFYPVAIPLDSDSDLVQVEGQTEASPGEIIHIFGRVLKEDGSPVPDARVEIWQCDNFGRYRHPGDRGGIADPRFQGYGQALTNGDGAYRFRTIKPVPYPGRTPHIHYAISGPGFEELVTQMYLDGHPLNPRDGILQSIRDEATRESLLIDFAPAGDIEAGAESGQFDIVLGRNAFRG